MGNIIGRRNDTNLPKNEHVSAVSTREPQEQQQQQHQQLLLQHQQRRTKSIHNLETLTDLRMCIVKGSLGDLTRRLESLPSSSMLDVQFPSRWVRQNLVNLDGHHGFPCACDPNWPPVSLCLLHVAASRGQPDMMEQLLRTGASPSVLDSNGESALHHAATNSDSFRALQFYSRIDQSRLLASWTSGSHRCVEILCSRLPVSDINVRSNRDMATALHRACEAGRDTSVSFLLAHGADANARNVFGETPAATALISGHETVFHQFIELGILQGRLDAVPYILHTAVNSYAESPTPDRFKNIVEILRYLVDLNEQDHLGNTALHYAVAGSMVDAQLVSTLLNKGANADLRNKMGRTALIEFFFSHQIRANNVNVKSIIMLASHMTYTPTIPLGQNICVSGNMSALWPPTLYREITDLIRRASRRVPSLCHLCRQVLRRAVGPHRLDNAEVMEALPLPAVLKHQLVEPRLDPESFCAQLVDHLISKAEHPQMAIPQRFQTDFRPIS